MTRLKALKYRRRLNRKIADALGPGAQAPKAQVDTLFRAFTPKAIDLPLIRVGGDHDGGYLVPDDLDGLEASYSPGVAEELDFDLEMAERGLACFLIDASIDGITTQHENITFERLFLGAVTEGNTISLNDWVMRNTPDARDLMLQIDIEGAEYNCLSSTPRDLLNRFRIIIIEFHDMHKAFAADGHAVLRETVNKLNDTHVLCHLHHNNCLSPATYSGIAFPEIFEATYIRKDRCKQLPHEARLPHHLDQPNLPHEIDWKLPEFWKRPG